MAKPLVTSPDGLSAELDETIDTVVLDCDGVVWHGDTLIPGAKAAVEALTARFELDGVRSSSLPRRSVPRFSTPSGQIMRNPACELSVAPRVHL